MGLDVVELLMEVEETFEIEITDAEGSMIETIGDLYQCILAKLSLKQSSGCATQRAFYILRRALRSARGGELEGVAIRPGTKLERVLPARERRVFWQRFQCEEHLKLPRLRLPAWVLLVVVAIGIAVTVGAVIVFELAPWLVLPIFGLVVWILIVASQPAAVELASSGETVGDLAKEIMTVNHATLAGGNTWAEPDVWEALKTVFKVQLDVPDELLKPEARILCDLGLS